MSISPGSKIFAETDWSERPQRHHLTQLCGYRAFHASDEEGFIADLTAHFTTFNPDGEVALRAQRAESPVPKWLHRMVRSVMQLREDRLIRETIALLNPPPHRAIDALRQIDL